MDSTSPTNLRKGIMKRKAKRHGMASTEGILMLTSMLDILTTILFFLLKNYANSVTDFNVGKYIELPRSSADCRPPSALQLIVTKNEVLLDNEHVAGIVGGDIERAALFKDGVTIVPLAEALKKQKERSLFIEQKTDAHSFSGLIILQADKSLPFSLLKKVIYTAGVCDFVMLKLAVLRKDSA